MRVEIGIILLIIAYASAGTYYAGNKVYLVTPQSYQQLDALKLLELELKLDFWDELLRIETDRSFRVMVRAEHQLKFVNEMDLNKISYRVLIENVDEMISKEKTRNLQARSHGRIVDGLDFSYFWTYSDIVAYLTKIASENPNIMEVEDLGNSFSGNKVYAVKISRSGAVDGTRPVVVVEGTIHAREWIGTMVCMHLISELVENGEQHDDFLNGIDWVIVPVVNVDGFIYTQVERLWRKTRSVIPGSECLGVDPNRNFAYKWDVLLGASTDPCEETFKGTAPASEIEVQLLSEVIGRYNNTVLYLAIHSYGKYLLYPWSYDYIVNDNFMQHDEVGRRVRSAIYAVQGTYYSLGSSGFTLYRASGISIDYALGHAKVPLAFTIELPGGGPDGFDIPPTEIEPVTAETFQGLREFAKFIQERFV